MGIQALPLAIPFLTCDKDRHPLGPRPWAWVNNENEQLLLNDQRECVFRH